MSRYRNCRPVNNDNDDGIDPVRLFVDRRRFANPAGPLNVPGIDPRRLFTLTSSDVNDVKRPIDVGRLPVRPAPDRPTDTTTPPTHTTLFQDDVLGPVHTFTVTGYAPLHCQLMYADRLLAPVAADRSHIILSWYSTIDGDILGDTDGHTDGDCDGTAVINTVGVTVVGDCEGMDDGLADGDVVGDDGGELDGCTDGDRVGNALGTIEGNNEGDEDGKGDGASDGDALGNSDGCNDG